MLAARRLVGVASEMNLRERVTQTQSDKPTLALKPRGEVTRIPKQGYQWPHKKDSCPPKKIVENDWDMFLILICIVLFVISYHSTSLSLTVFLSLSVFVLLVWYPFPNLPLHFYICVCVFSILLSFCFSLYVSLVFFWLSLSGCIIRVIVTVRNSNCGR